MLQSAKNQFIAFLIAGMLPLLFSGCLSVEPVKITQIKKIQINSVSMRGLDLDVLLIINNPNYFDINLDDADIDMQINGINVGKITSKESYKIKRNAEAEYNFLVNASFTDLLSDVLSVVNSLSRNEAEIKLVGQINVRSLWVKETIPIEKSQKVKLSR